MSTKLFVGGLSWDTTEDSLKQFVEAVTPTISVTIITDKFTGKSKGFGFVEVEGPDKAKEVMDKLNGQMLDGRTVNINEAKPLTPRPNRPMGMNRDFNNRRSFDNRRSFR